MSGCTCGGVDRQVGSWMGQKYRQMDEWVGRNGQMEGQVNGRVGDGWEEKEASDQLNPARV